MKSRFQSSVVAVALSAAAVLWIAAAPMQAQQSQTPIGTVSISDADVTAPIDVVGGKALLGANTTVTAHDHTAEVDLERHGLVLVCATTALHIADSSGANGSGNTGPSGPLMLSMDRGALELHILAHPGDELVTPDLRIESTNIASLNLDVRVARNGDTCIENGSDNPKAADAPTLEVHEQFGDGMYLLQPGQHVLFNYGSLRQVVDNETEPCGCPASPASLIADAGTAQSTQTSTSEKFPFPLAQSEGLAPSPTPAPGEPGETTVSIGTTMQIDGTRPMLPVPPLPSAQLASATGPSTPTQKTGFFHSIARFFHRLFGGK